MSRNCEDEIGGSVDRLGTVTATLMALACCHVGPSKRPGAVPTNQVLDSLKDELKLFSETKPTVIPKGTTCKGPHGKQIVSIVPQSAALNLKVVATTSESATAGVDIPIGSVLTVSPGFTGTYTRVDTQQITLNLNIDHPKTKKELRTEIDTLQKEMDSDQKYADMNKVSEPAVRRINTAKASTVRDDFKALIDAEESKDAGTSQTEYSPEAFKERPLAQALYSLREGLLAIDHNKTPCLTPDNLKVEIDFQVTTKFDATGKITFIIVSVGSEYVRTDDATQSLTVAFDLADSSTPVK